MTRDDCEKFGLDILQRDKNEGYLPQSIPIERDREIEAMLSTVIAERQLARLQHCVKHEHAMVLCAFAERMATSAVRGRAPVQLQIGLVALALSWLSSDWREPLMVLPLFYHAAQQLRLNPHSFFESTRQIVGDQLAHPLMQFLKRSDENKSLKSMGYIAGTDKDGFRYVREW